MNRMHPIKMPEEAEAARDATAAPLWHRVIAGTLKTLIPFLLLTVAAIAAWQIMKTAPTADRQVRPRIARLVEVVEVTPARQGPRLEAWGAVVPARTLALRSEVAGRVTELNPALAVGGEIAEGELLFAIDDRDARQAVAAATAEIARIDARIEIERGQGARAALDLQRLPNPERLTAAQRSLILRRPQMAELQAQRDAALAAREQAEIALGKTRVIAPFEAQVVEASIAPDARLTVGAEVATLVPIDRFEVRLAMPTAALDWLTIGDGDTVMLSQPGIWPDGATREGRIERIAPRLTPSARMAEVIAVVPDPMARLPENRGRPRLLIGSFLRAAIEGREVPDAVALDRALLRDENLVWVMTPDGTLDIREVAIAWRGASEVLISDGLDAGDRVVATDLASVAEGMALRLADERTAGTAQ